VRVKTLAVHLPCPEEFALDHLAATPVATNLDAVTSEVCEQIGATVRQELRSYWDGDGVTFPEETYFVTARL